MGYITMKWYFTAFRRVLDYKGRSRRSEFGWFVLVSTLLDLLYSILLMFSRRFLVMSLPGVPYLLLHELVFLIHMPVLIALLVRRLHDINRSGWWALLLVILPGVEAASRAMQRLALFSEAKDAIDLISTVLHFALVAIGFLALLLKEGTPGPNRFGLDPKVDP